MVFSAVSFSGGLDRLRLFSRVPGRHLFPGPEVLPEEALRAGCLMNYYETYYHVEASIGRFLGSGSCRRWDPDKFGRLFESYESMGPGEQAEVTAAWNALRRSEIRLEKDPGSNGEYVACKEAHARFLSLVRAAGVGYPDEEMVEGWFLAAEVLLT